MLKKAKAEAEASARKGDSGEAHGASSMSESSRQIWLAGLGAFSRVQAGGAKVFEALVRQGEALESRTRSAAADKAAAARGATVAKAREMKAMAGGTWDKLEQVFEDRVARALSKLGVYTQTDVERLSERVEELSDAVNELIKATGVKTKRRPPPSTMERMMKGAVKTAVGTAASAARSAKDTVDSATRTARKTVGTATRTAKKTVRTARKVAKAALD